MSEASEHLTELLPGHGVQYDDRNASEHAANAIAAIFWISNNGEVSEGLRKDSLVPHDILVLRELWNLTDVSLSCCRAQPCRGILQAAHPEPLELPADQRGGAAGALPWNPALMSLVL